MLPKNLARALGYLNHRDLVPALYHTSSPTSVQLNKNQSVTVTATTTTIRRIGMGNVKQAFVSNHVRLL